MGTPTKVSFSARNRKNTVNLAKWTFAWLLSHALVVYGAKFIWDEMGLTILVTILNVLLGLGMIFANIRFINGLDELARRIHVNAMSIALGIGVVGGLSMSTLAVNNLMPEPGVSGGVMLMAVTYLAAVIIGQVKYR